MLNTLNSYLSNLPPDHAAVVVIGVCLAPVIGALLVGFTAIHVSDVRAGR